MLTFQSLMKATTTMTSSSSTPSKTTTTAITSGPLPLPLGPVVFENDDVVDAEIAIAASSPTPAMKYALLLRNEQGNQNVCRETSRVRVYQTIKNEKGEEEVEAYLAKLEERVRFFKVIPVLTTTTTTTTTNGDTGSDTKSSRKQSVIFQELDSLKDDIGALQPTLDEVHCEIRCQAFDLTTGLPLSRLSPGYGPITLDPQVALAAQASIPIRVVDHENNEYIVSKSTSGATSSSSFPACLRSTDSEKTEPIDASKWIILRSHPSSVIFDGKRTFIFQSSEERDVATLIVRGGKMPPPPTPHPPPTNDDKIKRLEQRVREMEAQLSVAAAVAKPPPVSKMAETGKALAEAQNAKRELEKTRLELSALQETVVVLRDQSLGFEAKLREAEATVEILKQVEEERDEARGDAARGREALGRVSGDLASMKLRLGEVEMEESRLREENQKLEGELEILKRDLEVTKKRLVASEGEREAAFAQRNAFQTRVESQARDLLRFMKLAPGGPEEIEGLRSEREGLLREVGERAEEVKMLRAALFKERQLQQQQQQLQSGGGVGSAIGSSTSAAAAAGQFATPDFSSAASSFLSVFTGGASVPSPAPGRGSDNLVGFGSSPTATPVGGGFSSFGGGLESVASSASSFDAMKTKKYTMELGFLANNLIREIKEKDEVIERLKKDVERLNALLETKAVASRRALQGGER